MVKGDIIYQGSRLVVERMPEQQTKLDTIEITYNPRQTVGNKLQAHEKTNKGKQGALEKGNTGED